jgi:hypothetical protein
MRRLSLHDVARAFRQLEMLWRPRDRKKAADGIKTEAAFLGEREAYFTLRSARTKALLVEVEAHNFGALTFVEAENIAARLRRRYADAWRSA